MHLLLCICKQQHNVFLLSNTPFLIARNPWLGLASCIPFLKEKARVCTCLKNRNHFESIWTYFKVTLGVRVRRRKGIYYISNWVVWMISSSLHPNLQCDNKKIKNDNWAKTLALSSWVYSSSFSSTSSLFRFVLLQNLPKWAKLRRVFHSLFHSFSLFRCVHASL